MFEKGTSFHHCTNPPFFQTQHRGLCALVLEQGLETGGEGGWMEAREKACQPPLPPQDNSLGLDYLLGRALQSDPAAREGP